MEQYNVHCTHENTMLENNVFLAGLWFDWVIYCTECDLVLNGKRDTNV